VRTRQADAGVGKDDRRQSFEEVAELSLTSALNIKEHKGDRYHIGENLRPYIQAFSPAMRDIFKSFDFHLQVRRLAKLGLLYLMAEKFATIDLHLRL
jgi:hypothetical protein